MSVDIPFEVVTEILLRLPAKSLIRFRCVRKSWYSLISSSEFISRHLSFTTTNHSNNTHLLLGRMCYFLRNDRYSVHCDDQTFLQSQEIEFPFNTQFDLEYYKILFFALTDIDYFRIVGSCNGVLCLCDNHCANDLRINLWNPSIRVSMTLPQPHNWFPGEYRDKSVHGFGFDSHNNDYKVVRIVYVEGRAPFPPKVELYELSTNTWRNIKASPQCTICNDVSPVFLNGVVHWVGYNYRNNLVGQNGVRVMDKVLVLVLFDMGNEVFREMKLPDDVAGKRGSLLELRVLELGKSLSLVEYNNRGAIRTWWDPNGVCCIWVMKEYGVMESWTKVVTIDEQGRAGGMGRALSFRRNGEILIVTNEGELASYDPETGTMIFLEIRGHPGSFFVDYYVDSLVLLKGDSAISGQESYFDAGAYKRACVSLGKDDEVKGTKKAKGSAK